MRLPCQMGGEVLLSGFDRFFLMNAEDAARYAAEVNRYDALR